MSALKKRMTGLLQRKDSTPETHVQTERITDEAVQNASLSQLMDMFFKSGQSRDNIVALSLLPERAFENQSKAQEAVKIMRKKMSNWSTERPWEVFNCVMLIGIFARHEQGHIFTANVDDRFTGTIRQVLRDTSTASAETRVLIKETITEFDLTVSGQWQTENDPNKRAEREILRIRWKEDTGILRIIDLKKDPKNWQWVDAQNRSLRNAMPINYAQQPQWMLQQGSNRGPAATDEGLPQMLQLSERLREANTSSNILEQSMNAHTGNIDGLFRDELFQEFSARCNTASQSLQKYVDLIFNPRPESPIPAGYDDATTAEIVQTLARVSAVLRQRGELQTSYNAHRTQSRSPVAAPASNFSPPAGPPPNGTAPPLLAQPVATRPSNAAARLDNPFDDSNDIGQTGQAMQGLRLDTTSVSIPRPSAAVNSSSYSHNRAMPATTDFGEEPRVSAESEDRDRPRRYVF